MTWFLLGWLIAIILLAFPIATLYLLISVANLRRRVSELEAQGTLSDQVGDKQVKPTADLRPNKTSAVKPQPETPTPKPRPFPVRIPEGPGVHRRPQAPKGDRPKIDPWMQNLLAWAGANWIYLVSALSLALAGLFLVQESIERDLLSPRLRILLGLAFGGGLVVVGEWLRSRFAQSQKGEDQAATYLPATFASAGLIVLFGSIYTARTLYGLIGAEMSLIGLAGVGALALALGWRHGSFLIALGLVGSTSAPFIVGGETGDPTWLLIYFGLITLVGLGVDALRRWGWVSILSLSLGLGAGLLLVLAGLQDGPTLPLAYILYLGVLSLAVIAIPHRTLLRPQSTGPMILSQFWRAADGQAHFATRLSGGMLLASTLLIVGLSAIIPSTILFWPTVTVLGVEALALLVWARRAPALLDQTLLPVLGLLALVATDGSLWLLEIWRISHIDTQLAPAQVPLAATWLLILAALISVAAAWRSIKERGAARLFTALLATLLPPALGLTLDLVWMPVQALGSSLWAGHAIAVAGLMVLFARVFGVRDGGEDRLRISLAAVSAIACLAYTFVILVSDLALTLALATTVLAATWLDRRFSLPLMQVYGVVGVMATISRLVLSPGLPWALDAPIWELIGGFGGVIVLFCAAARLHQGLKRPWGRMALEAAWVSLVGVLASLLIYRWVDTVADTSNPETHWHFGISATIWLLIALAQWHQQGGGEDGMLGRFRRGLARAFFIASGIYLASALFGANPILVPNPVLGPPGLNSLIPAYLLPAIFLLLASYYMQSLTTRMRQVGYGLGAGLALLWGGMAIRHAWRGAGEMVASSGVTQPELYSYTLVLLCLGGGLISYALTRRLSVVRRVGLVVMGLTAAKVFLIDVAALDGFIRVFSLLLLGLSLAGLAWLDRWADTQNKTEGS